ncbi:hypothetical protein BC834DRAFT_1027167 [Gloeopeniophorella convolvens]|nr:hypothetical protein BC834DRAFT_1027167 [Gloeopeniophorella convolvens]
MYLLTPGAFFSVPRRSLSAPTRNARSIATTFREEGPAVLYKGLVPKVFRLAPRCVVARGRVHVGSVQGRYVHGAPEPHCFQQCHAAALACRISETM